MVDQPLILQQDINSVIVRLTLNRPEKRNALNIPLLKELYSALNAIQKNQNLRVIILNGSGTIFCAGLDLQEASLIEKENESAALIAKTLSLIYKMPKSRLRLYMERLLPGEQAWLAHAILSWHPQIAG